MSSSLILCLNCYCLWSKFYYFKWFFSEQDYKRYPQLLRKQITFLQNWEKWANQSSALCKYDRSILLPSSLSRPSCLIHVVVPAPSLAQRGPCICPRKRCVWLGGWTTVYFTEIFLYFFSICPSPSLPPMCGERNLKINMLIQFLAITTSQVLGSNCVGKVESTGRTRVSALSGVVSL